MSNFDILYPAKSESKENQIRIGNKKLIMFYFGRFSWPRGQVVGLGRSPSDITGLNPAVGMHVCLLQVLCVVR